MKRIALFPLAAIGLVACQDATQPLELGTLGEPALGIATPPAGLVSWWPGDRHANDIVGANHGTLENGATFALGKVGRAFSLDGEDDFVNVVPDNEQLNFGTNDFTVDFWVNFRSIVGEQIMVEKWIQKDGEVEESRGWTYTKIDNVRIRFAISDTDHDEFDIDFFPGIPTNSWIHVAATRAGDTYTMFWNGDPFGPEIPDVTYNLESTSSLKFGHRGNPDDTPGSMDERGFYLNGLIDEVEIFNRALSAEEIRAIFDAGTAGKRKPQVCVLHKGETIRIAAAALQAHLAHGDEQVECPS